MPVRVKRRQRTANLPISFRLYFSSILATLKISWRIGFFLALFAFLSANHVESCSIVMHSSLATLTSTFWMSGCCFSWGSTTSFSMWTSRWMRSVRRSAEPRRVP